MTKPFGFKRKGGTSPPKVLAFGIIDKKIGIFNGNSCLLVPSSLQGTPIAIPLASRFTQGANQDGQFQGCPFLIPLVSAGRARRWNEDASCATFCLLIFFAGIGLAGFSQEASDKKAGDKKVDKKAEAKKPFDAVHDAEIPQKVPITRPEQKKSKHDLSDKFSEDNSPPSSPALDIRAKRAG